MEYSWGKPSKHYLKQWFLNPLMSDGVVFAECHFQPSSPSVCCWKAHIVHMIFKDYEIQKEIVIIFSSWTVFYHLKQ